MCTEAATQRGSFGAVAQVGGGCVRVDVLHLIGIELSVVQRIRHRETCTLPVLGRRSDVVGITGPPETSFGAWIDRGVEVTLVVYDASLDS